MAILELIVMVIGTLIYPICVKNRAENIIVVSLGLDNVDEGMTTEEMLQNVNEKIEALHKENEALNKENNNKEKSCSDLQERYNILENQSSQLSDKYN